MSQPITTIIIHHKRQFLENRKAAYINNIMQIKRYTPGKYEKVDKNETRHTYANSFKAITVMGLVLLSRYFVNFLVGNMFYDDDVLCCET